MSTAAAIADGKHSPPSLFKGQKSLCVVMCRIPLTELTAIIHGPVAFAIYTIFINHCKSTWMFMAIIVVRHQTKRNEQQQNKRERRKYESRKKKEKKNYGRYVEWHSQTSHAHSHRAAATIHCYLTNWLTYGRKENRSNIHYVVVFHWSHRA